MKIKLLANQRTLPVSQALDPHSKKKNQRQMTQKMGLGTRLPFLQVPEERGREQDTATEGITKSAKTTDQKT